ncbi:hypothetical protein ACSSV5_001692 [Psychroflexus sp. MBR-150]
MILRDLKTSNSNGLISRFKSHNFLGKKRYRPWTVIQKEFYPIA